MPLTLNLLFHMHHEPDEVRATPRVYAEVLELIRQADSLPIGCAWLAEHHLSPTRGRLPAPLLFAVAAGRETHRIKVGPCVLVVPLHSPLALAEQIATADQLIGGRLAVGLGSGGNAEEFAAFGVPLAERRTRFAEGMEIIIQALRGAPFAFRGSHYQIPEVTLQPQPLQPSEALLWAAAGSVPSAELAGSMGMHLLLARGTGVPELQQQIAAYNAVRNDGGFPRPCHIQVTRGLYVAATDEQAWTEAAVGIRGYLRGSGRGDGSADLREAAQRADFIIGSPRTCAEAILALAEAIPITDLACDIFLFGMPQALMQRSLDLLGREVAGLLA